MVGATVQYTEPKLSSLASKLIAIRQELTNITI